jgi:uncharacterized protein YndB with AHSA1/START domain
VAVEELVVSTVVYLPPEEVYDFLVDFERYANYSKHLTEVTARGDGHQGTRYDMVFSWWKLRYVARSEVTETVPPERIEWRIVKDLDARGRWRVEPHDPPPAAPADVTEAARVLFEVTFDPDSAEAGMLNLPRFVIDKVKPIIQEEAERVVGRVVADIEGRERAVDLDVERRERKA